MSLPYRHTQVGSIALVIGGSFILLLAVILLSGRFHVALVGTLIIISLLIVNFMSMTVEVNTERLVVRLGPGILRVAYPIRSIMNCRVVQNSPASFWGIRWIGNGWLINVSGRQAVELQLGSGSRVRIGTDEPEKLATAIEDAMIASKHMK